MNLNKDLFIHFVFYPKSLNIHAFYVANLKARHAQMAERSQMLKCLFYDVNIWQKDPPQMLMKNSS